MIDLTDGGESIDVDVSDSGGTISADLSPAEENIDLSLDQQAVPIAVDLAEEGEELPVEFVDIQQSGGTGGGKDGEDGGYYLPSVAQSGEGEMTVDFVPSKADMPDVQPVTVTLPRGDPGPAYELTEEDKSEIVDAVLEEIPSSPVGSSVQADWNQNDESQPDFVKNRTHWLERPFEPIVWDGSTEGRDSVDLSLALGYPAGSVLAYKISDQTLTIDTLKLGNYNATVNGETPDPKQIISIVNGNEIVPGAIWQVDFSLYRIIDDAGDQEDYAGGTLFCSAFSGDFTASLGINIPSVGMYCIQSYGAPFALEINWDIYHKISPKFLPDNLASTDYVSAQIKQAIATSIGGSY